MADLLLDAERLRDDQLEPADQTIEVLDTLAAEPFALLHVGEIAGVQSAWCMVAALHQRIDGRGVLLSRQVCATEHVVRHVEGVVDRDGRFEETSRRRRTSSCRI